MSERSLKVLAELSKKFVGTPVLATNGAILPPWANDTLDDIYTRFVQAYDGDSDLSDDVRGSLFSAFMAGYVAGEAQWSLFEGAVDREAGRRL